MSATIATDKFASYLGLALSKEKGTKKVMMLNYQPQVDSIQGQWEDTADLILASPSSSHTTTKHTSKITTSNLAGNQSVPVLFIPGFTYPVTEYYKNEFENIVSSYITNLKRSNNSSSGSGSGGGRGGDGNNIDDDGGGGCGRYKCSGGGGGGSSQPKTGDINYELMSNLILTLAIGADPPTPTTGNNNNSNNNNTMLQRATGCILVFMPGTLEISKLIQRIQSDYQTILSNHTSQLNPSKSGFGQVDLKDTPDTTSNYNTSQLNSDRLIDIPRIKLLPLHGQLSQSEQKAVFELSDRELKIVVSTNVAEV